MNKQRLQIDQLERKISAFKEAKNIVPPPTGWINAVRVSLGMSLQQLAHKLSITKNYSKTIYGSHTISSRLTRDFVRDTTRTFMTLSIDTEMTMSKPRTNNLLRYLSTPRCR